MNDNKDIIGSASIAIPKEKPEIGVDYQEDFIDNLLDGIETDTVDTNVLESFNSVSQTREALYRTIDDMAMDDRVSSVLETYAEDVTETNDKGQIIWCESSDYRVSKFVSFLIDSLNIDKHIFEWTFSLIKYGDVYLKLYKEGEYKDDILFEQDKKESKQLNEDLLVSINDGNDKYAHYVRMVPNPGEMFDLTRFGKTVGFIQAPVAIQSVIDKSSIYNSYLTYKMKKSDVTVYGAGDFVHACLTNSNNVRFPEEVSIFKNDDDYEHNVSASKYEVKRGQSLLYNNFKVWRELALLENSVMLNRVVKSALVRILNVEVGNMPKSQVSAYMQRLKQNIEQKSAISVNKSMMDYTNPGPIENTIYIPTHEGKGQISLSTVGGDFDPKQLTDLDYFLNKFYGGLRVPKQFFGNTDDAAGFNGGSSLTILSSRYGKAIKKIQNIMCQLVTDLINLFLINKGLDSYINQFTIRMQTPVTQEELDRRDNLRNRIGIVSDVMNQIGSLVDDNIIKIKVLKSLLASSIADTEIISLLQEEIDRLEKEQEEEPEKEKKSSRGGKSDLSAIDNLPLPSSPGPENEPEELFGEEPMEVEEPVETGEEEISEPETSFIPSPNDLGQNFMDNI